VYAGFDIIIPILLAKVAIAKSRTRDPRLESGSGQFLS